MTKDEVQVGALVNVPTPRNDDDTEAYQRAVYYLDALLHNQGYPYDYLVIGEPYSSPDNVRLYMAPGFPQFCLDSFNVADLVCCQPAPAQLQLKPNDARALGQALLGPAPAPNEKLVAVLKRARGGAPTVQEEPAS